MIPGPCSRLIGHTIHTHRQHGGREVSAYFCGDASGASPHKWFAKLVIFFETAMIFSNFLYLNLIMGRRINANLHDFF